MRVSSFHRRFRAVTSMTPIQFQKEIRLREARARLIAEPGDVAGAGFAVGYDSPSQFSREYRRMFGVPPRRDALALREAAVLPSIQPAADPRGARGSTRDPLAAQTRAAVQVSAGIWLTGSHRRKLCA
jgi:AraC-like DNA-binding protein